VRHNGILVNGRRSRGQGQRATAHQGRARSDFRPRLPRMARCGHRRL
jgi:hypothetical protein